MKELVEFFTIKSVRHDELQGRVSGSLAWRLLRGETKQQADEEKVNHKLPVFCPFLLVQNYTHLEKETVKRKSVRIENCS